MRAMKDIEKMVSQAKLRSRPEVDKTVLDGLLDELAVSGKDGMTVRGAPMWRWTTPALAAALMAVASWIAITHMPRESGRPPFPGSRQSAGDMLTLGHLNAACRQGGWAEVETQCEQAADRLKLRPERISAEELIQELQGT
jgi:hypothetical protein